MQRNKAELKKASKWTEISAFIILVKSMQIFKCQKRDAKEGGTASLHTALHIVANPELIEFEQILSKHKI